MADLVAATSAAASIVIGTGVLSFSAPLIYDGINLLRVGGSYDGKLVTLAGITRYYVITQ